MERVLVYTKRFKFVDQRSKMFTRDVFFEGHLYVVSPLILGVIGGDVIAPAVKSVPAVALADDLRLRVVLNHAPLVVVYLRREHRVN